MLIPNAWCCGLVASRIAPVASDVSAIVTRDASQMARALPASSSEAEVNVSSGNLAIPWADVNPAPTTVCMTSMSFVTAVTR